MQQPIAKADFVVLDSEASGAIMNGRQRKIVLGAAAFVIASWILLPLLLSGRREAPPLSGATSFNAAAAHSLIREFVTTFSTRVLGSFESRLPTGYVRDYLEKIGYEVEFGHFEARIARRKQVGRNVLALRKGQSPEIIAIAAHIDTASTTTQGAMDNGSGVGVLLELARVFAENPTRRSLLLLFTDGGEWGMLGAGDIAANYPDKGRIAAVISLDHVGIGRLEAFCMEETGRLKGYAPPWLRELTRVAGESQGLPVVGSSGVSEYLNRSLLIPFTDQGPFLNVGIPAINLGSKSADRKKEREIYHTPLDTIENLETESIRQYGLAAEKIIRSIDALPSIPGNSSGDFRIFGSRYASPVLMAALQILTLLPIALAFWFHISIWGKPLNLTGAARELLAFVATVLPFWLIYFLIALFRVLRQIPIYSIYPATPKDPVLLSPPWGILAGIIGSALFISACSTLIIWYGTREIPKPRFEVSKTILLSLMLIAVILGLFYNPWWATLFFVLPAWIWALTGRGATSRARAANAILIVAAGAVYYLTLVTYASRLGLRWNFIWYQVIALGDGLFSMTAYFLATAVVAIGIRLLVIQLSAKQAS